MLLPIQPYRTIITRKIYLSSDIKIVTREFQTSPQPLRNWTARAGTFLEESRAFIDKYLVKRELPETAINRAEETVESSGATSGDDVWGTPTSGGEYDDPNTFGGTTDQSQMVRAKLGGA